MENKRPLLSICIPTWNRSKFLSKSLDSFISHIKEIDVSELELYVSDNCSDDNTSSVVEAYKDKGLPITYNRNSENIGASGNFLKCMTWASGKYILLLGDDDILKPGSVKLILDSIRGKDYGLIHIHEYPNIKGRMVEYNNHEAFIKQISFWFTFMSGSIFRKDIVGSVRPERYLKTHLLQIPYYINSLLSKSDNLLISQGIIEEGLDSSNNGGYNFYEVFVTNYLSIWHDFVEEKKIDKILFEWIKKDVYVNFIEDFSEMFFVDKKNIKSEDASNVGNRSGFKIAGAKEILDKHYGSYFYYKKSVMKLFCKRTIKLLRDRCLIKF